MKQLAILGWTFLWISSVTLGGGMAMLPLMDREFVERRKWLTAEEMLDVVAVMQSLPGLIVVNMAVLIGYRVKGVAGAAVAAFASVLTPFLAIAVLARCLAALTGSPTLDHVFLGIRAGTAALVLMSLVKLMKSAIKGPVAWTLAVGSFVAAVFLRIDLALVVAFGFAIGVAMVACGGRKETKGQRDEGRGVQPDAEGGKRP